MNDGPVRLCCMERHFGSVCPDGKVMCQICFERFNLDQLHRDTDGVLVNVCKGCVE